MATTTAYMVLAGEYEDRRALVISLDQATAQRYATHHNAQRNRTVFAEVEEIEIIDATWVAPVTPELFCENCQAEFTIDCYCAVPIGDDGMSAATAPVDPATQRPLYPHPDAGAISPTGRQVIPPMPVIVGLDTYVATTGHCPGCFGAGTGRRCCICGGLR